MIFLSACLGVMLVALGVLLASHLTQNEPMAAFDTAFSGLIATAIVSFLPL